MKKFLLFLVLGLPLIAWSWNGPGTDEKNNTKSPDGKLEAFTKGSNLFVRNLESGHIKQLTFDKDPLIYNGYASWVYFEEILGRRSNYRAFYWAPNSDKIAFLRFDDNPVPLFPITRSEGVHGDLEKTRYPKPGDPNPHVQLAVAHLESGKITWVREDPGVDQYTAWCYWTPDGEELYFQELNRDQNHLKLLSANPKTGERKLLVEEKVKTWVDFYKNLEFLKDESGFVLTSERDGWNNIYYYNPDGKLVCRIGEEGMKVANISYLNEETKKIYFSADRGVNRHFFIGDISSGKFQQITKADGWHMARLNEEKGQFEIRHSAIDQPPGTKIYDMEGKFLKVKEEPGEDKDAEAGIKKEIVYVKTADGFNLPVSIAYPPGFSNRGSYPVIFSVYGGPASQSVRNAHRSMAYDELLKNGIIRISFDHRGSGQFGKKGKDYMHRNLGKWEMEDFITVVKWLHGKSYVDKTRIGIQGGSYGGYFVALALTYASDYVTHGISSYPVTDWRLYDNVYTERYMDTPYDNPEGYKFGSVMTHAENYKGNMLIVHGSTDDNVHMQNTFQLISLLQDLNKDFEMMIYPEQRHGVRGDKRKHSRKLTENFWTKHMLGKTTRS